MWCRVSRYLPACVCRSRRVQSCTRITRLISTATCGRSCRTSALLATVPMPSMSKATCGSIFMKTPCRRTTRATRRLCRASRRRAKSCDGSMRDADERMPPEKSHKTLTAAEKRCSPVGLPKGPSTNSIGRLSRRCGRKCRRYNSRFENLQSAIRSINFVAARLQREGLAMSPEADKTTLIRRVTLDLTGLPPTIAEVDAFLADTSENAYEKVVDRLLASPALRRADGDVVARRGPLCRQRTAISPTTSGTCGAGAIG